MTGRTRWNRYTDHRGRTISVRAVQNASGEWEEMWEIQQLMRADLSGSGDEDTSPEPVLVHRSVSNGSQGSQPHLNTSTAPRATKNANRKERRR